MKKVLFGLFALSTLAFAGETNLYLRTGADLNGKYDVFKDEEMKLNKKDADEFSWEIAVEATKEVYANFELGFGVAYQKHGDPKKFTDVYTYTDSDNDTYDCVDNYEMPGYTSIPLYVVAKYNFNAINNFVPYVKANLGYSLNDENGDVKYFGTERDVNTGEVYSDSLKADIKVKNGLYYGIGAGFEYNNFTMDLMYQVNEAKAELTVDDGYEVEKYKKDYDYSRITLGFGYKFNF